jgi:hypothetical protein
MNIQEGQRRTTKSIGWAILGGAILSYISIKARVWGSTDGLDGAQNLFAWPSEPNLKLLAYISTFWIFQIPGNLLICMPVGWSTYRESWLICLIPPLIATTSWLALSNWVIDFSFIFAAEIFGLFFIGVFAATLGRRIAMRNRRKKLG